MELKRTFLLSVFCLGILNAAAAPAAWGQMSAPVEVPSSATSAQPASGIEAAQNPQIQPGDVVSIIVYPADEYNREVTVQPDGKIELPLIGSLQAGGLTAKELSHLLESKYSRYVDNPKITVATRHFAGRRIAIIGEIRQPGYYEYRDGMKMLELVAHAGGLTDLAHASHTSVMRQGAAQAVRFNFQAVLDGHLDRDIVLLPGDTIYIPKTGLARRSTWLTNNIIPWLTFITAIATMVILAKTN